MMFHNLFSHRHLIFRLFWRFLCGERLLQIMLHVTIILGCFPHVSSGKESTCQSRRFGFNPWVRKIPWRRKRQPTPVFLPAEFHGQKSLVGCSPWGHKESDTTERQYVVLRIKSFNCISCSKKLILLPKWPNTPN